MQISSPKSEIKSWRAWSVVLSVSLISFLLIGSTLASLAVYMPVFQTHFIWSESDVGLIAAVLLLGVSIFGIIAGWLLNKIGARALIIGGIITVSFGCLLAARATSLTHMIIAIGLIGAGIGAGTITPSVTVINLWFRAKRGMPMAVFIGTLVISSALLPRVTDILIENFGWQNALQTAAIAIAVTGLFLSAFVRVPLLSNEMPKPDVTDQSPQDTIGLTVKEALKSSRVWMLIAALTLAQLCINGILYNVVSYLIAQDFSSSKAVSIYSLANLCGLPGLFICGFLADRFGARRVIPFAALILAGGTFALLSVTGSTDVSRLALIGFILMWGLGGSVLPQIGPIILAEIVGMRAFPAVMGIRGAVVGLVGASAPVLVGVLFAVEQSYRLPFIVCALLALASVPLFLLVSRSEKRSSAAPL